MTKPGAMRIHGISIKNHYGKVQEGLRPVNQ